MSIVDKIFGLDILCSNYGENVGIGPEYKCIPVIVLQSRHGSLLPGYTIKKYWDKESNFVLGSDYGWDEKMRDSEVPVIIPFPQKILTGIRTLTSSIKPLLILQKPGTDYLDIDNIREVDKFDHSGFIDVVEYIKDNRTLTVVISDMESVHDLLHKFNREIVDNFKYCIVNHHGSGNGKVNIPKHHTLLFHITFINLNMCIPIFDRDKTDGMGIICEYVYKSDNGIDYVLTGRGMSMILSNDEENVITVDGTVIGESYPPRSELIKSLMLIAVNAIQQKRGKSDDSQLLAPKDSTSLGSGGVLVNNDFSNNTVTYSSGGYNTTASFYTNS